jgi:hypothetical protein
MGESVNNRRRANLSTDKKMTQVSGTGSSVSAMDYRRYYNLERYLLDEVSSRYKRDGVLNTFDFFCIIIWKANRAKSRVARRMLRGFSTLDEATTSLTDSIAQAEDDRKRMKILVKDWGFRLPIASAILTVLYPDKFSVYDSRVCDMIDGFRDTQSLTNFEKLWTEYERYVKAVRRAVIGNYSLRDKDRWLWGKSFAKQLAKDIARRFEK